MLHFYKTNVAYLQVLLICRGKRPHRHRKFLKISVTETKFNPSEFISLRTKFSLVWGAPQGYWSVSYDK